MLGVHHSSSRNFLIHWIVQKELAEAGQKYLGGRLIDIGCGSKPYEKLLGQYVYQYIGLDHNERGDVVNHVDIECTAYDIPVDDESIDSAICTAVLEHLEEPEKALKECWRVLKVGGMAIYTVPFIWHIHEEPRDFYRYSEFGLRYLFEKTGFEIVELNALSGFYVTFGQELVYFLWRLRKGGKWNPLWWLIPPFGMLIQLAAFGLDKLDRDEKWTWMYLLVARK